MGDEDHAHPEIPLQLPQQPDDLILNCYVERCRWLVGKQKGWLRGKSDGNHCPLPHPAGKLMRIRAKSLFGGWDSNQLHQLDCSFFLLLLCHGLLKGFHDLTADCLHWI